MRRTRTVLAGVMTFLLCITAPVLEARVDIKPGFNTFSPQQDIELGQQAAQQVEKQFPMVNDPQINGYVSRLGKRLAGYAPGYKFPYQFDVVNQKQINAFAIPGGHIYVHTGTIAAAANEAQLAGVLSHEIAHIALRHSTNQASKAMLAQAPIQILGGVLGGSGGLAGQLAQLGIAFGANSVFLKFSRTAERQADELGAQIMYDAGYDPRAMAQFFEIIQKQGGSGTLEFLSDHPNPGNRIQNVNQLVPKLGPGRNFTNNSPDFEQVKRRVGGLPPAPARGPQAQGGGQVQQPPAPSRNMRGINANFFSIAFPDNWQAAGQDSGAVTIVPPGGVVQGARNVPEIAYGAVASIFEPQETRRRLTLQDATNQLLAQLQQSNPHLHLVSNGSRRLRLDGQDALSVMAMGQSAVDGEAELNWIVTTFRPEGLWYVAFIAPEHDWNQYERVFERMLQSVRFPR
ncbi:MAG: M48 family metalloprotease [Acidobacteria bacterium]|nr:M48 family metalloprotease [Acidobacteriota bacterium]